MLALVSLLILAAGAVNAVQHYQVVPAFTNNNVEQLLIPNQKRTFKAKTCDLYDEDFDIIISVFLPKNPAGNTALGVVTLNATSVKPTPGTVVTPEQQICHTSFDNLAMDCKTKMKSSWTDIYVTVTGNPVPDINFDVSISFVYNPSRKVEAQQVKQPYVLRPEDVSADPIDNLKPFYELRSNIQAPYLEAMQFEVKLCPADDQGSAVEVTSIFQANDPDGLSTVAQWMCSEEPCDLTAAGTKNIKAGNAQALPFNYLRLSGHYTSIYVYALSYNGVLAASAAAPVGDFIFGVTTKST